MANLIGILIVSLVSTLAQQSIAEEITAYRLRTGDSLKVSVFGHADLSGEFSLSESGSISLPLIQEIGAAGLTCQELESAITEKLQPDYLKNPRVTVEMLNYRPIYVLGEVNQPGTYPYAPHLTLNAAIAQAGGYTYRAKSSAVVITRAGSTGNNAGQVSAKSDSALFPGDIIEVPERFF